MTRSVFTAMARLSILCLALVAIVTSQVNGFKSKQQVDLFQKIQSSSAGYIDLDSTEFAQLMQYPRDFAVTALLTATDASLKCMPCKTFQPEFENVASQWNRNKQVKKKNVFVKLEFTQNKQIFAQFQLQHAPVLFVFPASTDANPSPDHINYDFNVHGFEADAVANHVSKSLGVDFKYKKPMNVKLISITATAMVTLAATLFFLAPYLPMFFTSSKPFWMLVSLGSMIIFNSGYLWNGIRGAPYVAMNNQGKPEYFAGGFQNQYGVETQIIAGIYSLLAFSFIALTVLVPRQRDPTRQRAGVYVWSVIFLGTFSLLFMIFRMKNPSYPFRLFF